VVDLFAAAGLEKPDISILSEEFLAEVRGMPQQNLAIEAPAQAPVGRDQDPATEERGRRLSPH
jgi:hypothetical protein